MIGSRILLFLFGITIASSHVLRNGKPCKHGHLHSADGKIIVMEPSHLADEMPAALQPLVFPAPSAPMYVPPFMQQGTNLFYKPQFTLPGMIPSPITTFVEHQKDCHKKPEVSTVIIPPTPLEEVHVEPIVIPQPPELPQPVIAEPVGIPQPPELPPFTLPEPVVVEVEQQHTPEFHPIEIPEAPMLPPFKLPELPPVIITSVPEIQQIEPVTIPEAPILPPTVLPVIPEAPVLPPFEMPEMPVVVVPAKTECEEQHNTVVIPEAPVLPPMVIPVAPELPELKPFSIPEAPVLPPLTLPEIPVVIPVTPEIPEFKPVQIPEAPKLPPFIMSNVVIPVAPEVPQSKPLVIPEAPVLPPMPELPAIPVAPEVPFVEIQPQSITEWISPAAPEPMVIPEAPTLSPLEMPQLPIEIVPGPIEMSSPYPPEIIVAPSAPELKIPEAPRLPPFTMPVLPTFEPMESNEVIPTQEFVSTPTYVPVIDVRVPEIKNVVIPEAPVLPPLSMAVIPEPIVVEEAEEPRPEDEVQPPQMVHTLRIPEIRIPALEQQQFALPTATFMAQNIIIERVLPNIILDCDKAELEGKHPVIPQRFFATARY